MDMSQTFTVSRARPEDAEAIAEFVARATHGRVSAEPKSVVQRFGAKGLWLARDDPRAIVAVAGWRAENLIARVDDFLVYPVSLYPSAGQALIDSIERAAQELQCEVCVLLVPLGASPTALSFYESCGYARPEPDALPKVWQETVAEAAQRGRYVMLKQLREDLVLRPI